MPDETRVLISALPVSVGMKVVTLYKPGHISLAQPRVLPVIQ